MTLPIDRERRLLQAMIAVLAFLPVVAGLSGVALGPAMVEATGGGVSADSHLRYLSGLLLAIGLCFWRTIPVIERAGSTVRLLTFLVFIGGLARLASLIALGPPALPMLGGLIMELVVTPLICLWQMHLARRYHSIAIAGLPTTPGPPAGARTRDPRAKDDRAIADIGRGRDIRPRSLDERAR